MAITLHVFVDEGDLDGKQMTVMQGWEFPEVIVEAESYKKAEHEFIKGVETSLRANLLQALENWQDYILKKNLSADDFKFLVNVNKYSSVLNSLLPVEEALQASLTFQPVLEVYMELPDQKMYKNSPPHDTKEVIFT